MDRICKHYVRKSCTKNPCQYQHIDDICPHYFFATCRNGASCAKSHQFKLRVGSTFTTNSSLQPSSQTAIESSQTALESSQTVPPPSIPNQCNPNDNRNRKPKHKAKNTESFIPSHKPADMTIKIGNETSCKYNHPYHSRDVILVSNLFNDMGDVYTQLLQEMKECQSDEVWKLWHGDSHWIADDHMKWKDQCPTFTMVIDRIQRYFQMDIKATRLNWYKDTSEWKPYHHDAAAIDPKKAKSQNITIGVSFGATREAAFEHATTKTVISIPLSNGMIYGFGSQVNIDWRHGIPQMQVLLDQGRISIIAWGWCEMND